MGSEDDVLQPETTLREGTVFGVPVPKHEIHSVELDGVEVPTPVEQPAEDDTFLNPAPSEEVRAVKAPPVQTVEEALATGKPRHVVTPMKVGDLAPQPAEEDVVVNDPLSGLLEKLAARRGRVLRAKATVKSRRAEIDTLRKRIQAAQVEIQETEATARNDHEAMQRAGAQVVDALVADNEFPGVE